MKRFIALIVFALLMAVVFMYTHSEATLYKWKDRQGRVHITDYPPPPEEVGLPSEGPQEPILFKKKKEEPKEEPLEPLPQIVQPEEPPPVVIPQKPKASPQGVLKLPVPTEKKPSQEVKKPEEKPAPKKPPARKPRKKKIPRRATLPPVRKGPEGAQLMALLSLGGLFYMVLMIALSLLIYFYTALVIHIIGQKRGVSYAWTVWIPIVGNITSIFVILASAGRPLWWALLFLLPAVAVFGSFNIPILGIVALVLSLLTIVLMVFLWMEITRNLKLNKWLGLLVIVPIVNLGFMGYLAFKPEEDVEINKKKMIIVAAVVYILLVVGSAVAIQYLLMPYFHNLMNQTITRQLNKQPRQPGLTPSGKKNVSSVKLPQPQAMTSEAYDAVLQRKAPPFTQAPYTSAGPAVLKLDHFWDDPNSPHVWLKVRTPLFPNLHYSTIEVKIQKVLSVNGADLYDRNSMFETSPVFHQAHLFAKNNFAEGQRDIHLLKGTQKDMIKGITGEVVFRLPLRLKSAQLKVAKGSKITFGKTSITINEAFGEKVSLTVEGKVKVVKIVGINNAGKEFVPTMTMTSDTKRGKKIEMAFPERPASIKLILSDGEYVKRYPFSLKVK